MADEERIMIAGGAGYIGSQVNKVLNEQGRATVVVDNLSTGHGELVRWGDFHRCDLGDAEGLRAIFGRYRVSAVMNFSAFTYVEESVRDPEKYYINNVKNTINLLAVMREYGVGTFIFSSSAAVYGVPDAVPITEEHRTAPINPYGATKLMVENILADYARAYGLRYAALRYFNAAGADPGGEIGEWHEPETHLVPLVLDAALGARDAIAIFGTDYDTPDGSCVRDYIHVADLADAHIRALEYLRGGGGSGSFNLGNGKGFSVREVIDAARSVTGREIRVREEGRRPGDPAVLVAGAEKAASQLGWRPRYTEIAEILETAWRWHRELYGSYKR